MPKQIQKLQQVDISSFPLQGLSLIEASAGTGKTYTIAHLYLRMLLEREFEVNQILVVTFTIAATDELRGRIRQLIYLALKSLNGEKHEETTTELLKIIGPYRQSEQAKRKLQQALICFDEAAIFTIHSFCQQILQNMVVESSSPFDLQFIGSEKALELQLAQDFWRKFIIGLDLALLQWLIAIIPSPVALLDKIQPALILQPKQINEKAISLVLIPADKLKALFELLQKDWSNREQSLREILLNSSALNRKKYYKPTLNKLFTALDTWFALRDYLNFPEGFSRLYSSKIQLSLNKDKTDVNLQDNFFEICEAFGQLLEIWQQQQLPKVLQTAIDFVRQGKVLQKKQDRNQSFDDLISRLHYGLSQPGSKLANDISRLFPLALVDEFQDTDLLQYQIFRQIYVDQNEICLVLMGDPKQAIYSFRGADVFTYQQAKSDTDLQFTLDTNYRSSPSYIDAINRIFSQQTNVFLFEKLMSYHPVAASADNGSCLCDGKPIAVMNYWLMPAEEKPISKERASLYMAETCASEIAQILRQKKLEIEGRKVVASDLAILVRSANQGVLMQQQLRLKNISSVMVSNQSIYHSEQADDIVLLLAVLTDTQNMALLFGLLASRLFGWNTRQIDQLKNDSNQVSQLLKQMSQYRQICQQQGVFCMLLQLFRDQQAVQRVLQDIDGDRCLTNWLQLIELLQQQSQIHASLSQTLSFLQLQRQNEIAEKEEESQLRLDSDEQLIRIITIHKSKGLEFPLVFLPFIWEVRKDFTQPSEIYNYHDENGSNQLAILNDSFAESFQQEQLAEQMRLFYVSLTRAKYACYFGWGHIKYAGSSALAACLFADKLPEQHPGELNVKSDQEISDIFDELNFRQSKPDRTLDLFDSNFEAKPSAPPKAFNADVQQLWRISSYSALVRSKLGNVAAEIYNDLPDYDAIDSDQPAQLESATNLEFTRFTFPKGARPGNFLHELLELQSFDKPVDGLLVRHKLAEYGYQEEWLECLQDWLGDILETSLSGELSLNKLKPESMLNEMEFYFSVNRLTAESLNLFLQQYDYLNQSNIGYDFFPLSGFIKGFIDLTFEWQGKFYICDYKSNFLGDKVEDYNPETCEQAMDQHHYHLQYLIYSLALHRYLSRRIKDYDYEIHFGGVYYLFLRGMQPESKSTNGVLFFRPKYQLIQKLDALIGPKDVE